MYTESNGDNWDYYFERRKVSLNLMMHIPCYYKKRMAFTEIHERVIRLKENVENHSKDLLLIVVVVFSFSSLLCTKLSDAIITR